ncbi:hypothetical protein [Thiobacillus sp.]|uniref:hypothetical protein n=1 Tax=Thiobacillus sp. TaxID=924 RepID=UPI0025FD252A|nr:hypothetical protein [Thiobacillus sp.]
MPCSGGSFSRRLARGHVGSLETLSQRHVVEGIQLRTTENAATKSTEFNMGRKQFTLLASHLFLFSDRNSGPKQCRLHLADLTAAPMDIFH